MIITAAVAAVLTLIVSLVPSALAYRAPEGHVVIETAAALVSLLVAFILVGRFFRRRLLVDLLLAAALAVIGLSNLLFAVAPAAAGHPLSHWAAWAAASGRLGGSVIFCVAAYVPDRRVRAGRGSAVRVAVACSVLLAAIAIGVALAGPGLPLGIDPGVEPKPRVVGAAGVLVIQLLLMVVYAVAAIGFARRAERTGDGLMGWFALGAVVYAFAGLNF